MARKTYTDQFKQDAVKLVTDEDYTIAQAADALGVSQTAISNWVKTLAPREQADLETENERLRRENRQLRTERDILKKAATFFAKENQ